MIYQPRLYLPCVCGRLNFQHRVYSPRCRHETASVNQTGQEWVAEALERTILRMMSGGDFQSSSCSCSQSNTVHKRLPVLSKVKELHAHMMETGNELQRFEKNSLIDMYVKCGSMVDARHVFENMSRRNVVSWNMMILGYAKQEEGVLGLELFARMHQEGVQPSDRTLVAALKACSSLVELEEAKKIDVKLMKMWCLEKGRALHSQTLKGVFESDVFVGNTLIDMYVKCGSMKDARHVFDEMPCRDVVSWTAMILGYAQKNEGMLALELYARMYQEGVLPSDRTIVGALKACNSLVALEERKQVDRTFARIGCLEKVRAIHSQVFESKFESNIHVGTILVDIYAKCGIMEDAWHVFDELPQHNVVSWNTMISGHVQMEESALALDLYTCMHQEGVKPSDRTFVGTLKACSSLAALEEGKLVHGKVMKLVCLEKGRAIHFQVMKNGYESDVFVGTSFVDMYAKCGSLKDARHVFDELPHRNVVSWNAMISGYAEQDEGGEALKLHAQMQKQGLLANNVTFVSILKACGTAAALNAGMEHHAESCRVGLHTPMIVANCLIDMYAKCGSMVDAQHMFDALPMRNFVTWNALIAGYACQGESEHVFDLFEKMREEGIQPNGVTFLSVLIVCSHVGLVHKGQKYFEAMSKEYDTVPAIEHYTCMIDLLGRAGQVEAAVAMVEKMPFQPDAVSWVAVLGACWKWKNMDVGRNAFNHVMRFNEKSPAAYVLMSNIYAADMCKDHDRIQGMKKNL